MDNVLITGGSGFVGSWLCRDPHGLVVPIGAKAYESGDWFDGTWRNIIHLAPVPVDDVLECARRNNARVLFASSGGVYDREPEGYFQQKKEDERKLLDSGIDVRIARIFTTCGADMDWERYAIGNFIIQASKGGPIKVFSRGLVVRSYMYGSDLAEWLWRILLDGEPGGVYNVGSDEAHSTQELAFEVANLFEPCPKIEISKTMSNEPRPWYVPDISRARDELGLSINVPFAEAVRRTVEDYRNAH